MNGSTEAAEAKSRNCSRRSLGWKLWDQLLTEEIAQACALPQGRRRGSRGTTDPLYYRLFKSFLRGSYEGSLNAHKLNVVDSESILKITEEVVQHAAKKGNSVIVGRGSQHFLRDRTDTLRVFLYAPRENKVRRLLARGKSEKEAEQLVDSVDRERADFIQKYFRVEWPDRAVYHTMINTAIGDEAVVHMILDFMKTVDASAAA